MRIGIWGLYDKGNFGDDLMAAMFYKYLTKIGYEAVIFNASPYLKKELDAQASDNISQFVNSVDVVIIGGGGMLVNNPIIKVILKKEEFKFEYSFYALLKSLKKHNKKLIPISIGGSNAIKLNNKFKSILFSSRYTSGGTVRLVSDLNLVEKDIFNYFPDVVLSTSKFFPAVSKNDPSRKRKIILNLKNKSAGPLVEALKIKGLFDSFDIYTFSSHVKSRAGFGAYEFKLKDQNLEFTTITEALGFLSDADVVISSKLHVGVSALSYNVPFISYKGPRKAKEFLIDYGKEEWVINDADEIVNKLSNFNESFAGCKFNDGNLLASYSHFDYLSKLLPNRS